METCKFGYYKVDDSADYPFLYCSVTNRLCEYTKKCNDHKRYVTIEQYKGCDTYKEKIKHRKIPNGAYRIETKLKTDKGLILYVSDGKYTDKYVTDLKEYDKDYIYIKKIRNKVEFSESPFATKKQTKKK